MITSEDILKIRAELTEEEFQKLVYYLSKDNILELKEIARKKAKKNFVNSMRKKTNCYINNLYINNNVRRETINLLNQTKMSLKNVYKLINAKSIVDANTILRSAFENLIMGMMINYDSNVYNEFINLNIDDTTRTFTKPIRLRNKFRKILKELDGELFNNFSNRKLRDFLDEFYDKLCLFTHSSLIVNAMVELKKDNKEDLYIFAIKQNTYFIEILLYLCLKHLSNDEGNTIDFTYAIIGYVIVLSDINKENISEESIEQLKKYLLFDLNENYINTSSFNIEDLKKEIIEFQSEIENNSLEIIRIIKDIIK